MSSDESFAVRAVEGDRCRMKTCDSFLCTYVPRQTGRTKEKKIPLAKIYISKEGLSPCLNLIKSGHLGSHNFSLESFYLYRGLGTRPKSCKLNFFCHCLLPPHHYGSMLEILLPKNMHRPSSELRIKEFPSSDKCCRWNEGRYRIHLP